MNNRIYLITLMVVIALSVPVGLLLIGRRANAPTERHSQEQALEQKLQTRVSVRWEDMPLSETCRRFADNAGLPLEMTSVFRKYCEPCADEDRVTLRFDDIRLADLLRVVQLEIEQSTEGHLVLDPRESKLILMADASNPPKHIARLYSIPAGLFPHATSGRQLADTIRKVVDRRSWKGLDDEGDIEILGTALLVKQTPRNQRELAALFDGLRRHGDRPDSLEPILAGGSPDDERIWRVLRETTDILADGRPWTLPQLCEEIHRRHGINVHLCVPHNPDGAKYLDQPLTLWLGRVRLDALLGHLSRHSLPYCFSVQNGTLRLMPGLGSGRTDDSLIWRLYPVGDLIENAGGSGEIPVFFSKMVDYNTYSQMALLGDVLACRQDYQTHREIERLLAMLRRCHIVRPWRLPMDEPTSTVRQIEERMNQALPRADFETPIPLGRYAGHLRDRYGVNVVVDGSMAGDIHRLLSESLFSPNQPGEPLGKYLTRQMKKYDLIWYPADEAIVIGDAVREPECRWSWWFYDARPMIDATFPLLPDDEMKRELIRELITEAIDPDTWWNDSGSGRIADFDGYFFVLQKPSAHEKIARLQDELAAGDLEGYDRLNIEKKGEDTSGPPGVWNPVHYPVADLVEYYRFERPWQLRLQRPYYDYTLSVAQSQQLHVGPEPAFLFLVETFSRGEGILFDYTAARRNRTSRTKLSNVSDATNHILWGTSVLRWEESTGRLVCRGNSQTAQNVGRAIDYLNEMTGRFPLPDDLFGPRSEETVELLLDWMLDDDAPPLDRAYADFLLSGYLYAIPEAGGILLERLRETDVVKQPDRFILLCRLIAATGSFDEEMLPVLQDAWRLGDELVRAEIVLIFWENLGSPEVRIVFEGLFDELEVKDLVHASFSLIPPLDMCRSREIVYYLPAISDTMLEKKLLVFSQLDIDSSIRRETWRVLSRFDPAGRRTRAIYDRWMAGSSEQREEVRRLRERLPGWFDENE